MIDKTLKQSNSEQSAERIVKIKKNIGNVCETVNSFVGALGAVGASTTMGKGGKAAVAAGYTFCNSTHLQDQLAKQLVKEEIPAKAGDLKHELDKQSLNP